MIKLLPRGALYLMLQNRLYRGEIVHNERSHLGEHEPIIDSHSGMQSRPSLPATPPSATHMTEELRRLPFRGSSCDRDQVHLRLG